jgi:hypothetical protein
LFKAAEKKLIHSFLLDENFQRHQLRDRHIDGCCCDKKALVKWVAAGLVSTHDLELGELEYVKDFDIEKLSFFGGYINNQIYLIKAAYREYQNHNALFLMRMVE